MPDQMLPELANEDIQVALQGITKVLDDYENGLGTRYADFRSNINKALSIISFLHDKKAIVVPTEPDA